MSITNLSLAQLKEIVSVKEQIGNLEQKLSKLLGGKALTSVIAPAKKTRRKMSAAARAKIAAAQKARWAKAKGTGKAAPTAKPAKKTKRTLSPEGRARIVAALKKRWAAKKK